MFYAYDKYLSVTNRLQQGSYVVIEWLPRQEMSLGLSLCNYAAGKSLMHVKCESVEVRD